MIWDLAMLVWLSLFGLADLGVADLDFGFVAALCLILGLY